MTENISVEEFEIFKEAMIEENLAVQIEITRKLSSLAKLLGEKATREELLPFVQDHIDFHDEILLNLSEQLKYFIPLVGGYEYSKPVLDLLVKLCNTDENIVREKSIETLKSVGESLDNENMERLYLPVVEQLASDEWFTSKCSAAALFSTCYPKMSDDKKEELRISFRVLIQDDSPMVRKAAAIASVDFINCLEVEHIKNEFIPVFDNIAQDPMDSVKITAVDVAIALSKILTQNEIEEFVLKTVESWCDVSSWRLRQRLAFSIADIQKVIPYAKTRGKILSIYQSLSKDPESEVRVLIAKNIYNYSKSLLESYLAQPQYENNFEAVFENSILPVIHRLLTDTSEEVRLAVSSNFLSLSSLLSKGSLKTNILPLLIDVLENETSMLFQANMLQSLNYIPNNVDLSESLYSIKKVIRSIIVNSQSHWRTRRSILVALIHISRFASKEYFSENLKIFYAALLGDIVFAIRRSSSLILPLLADHYGIKWASDNLIPYFMMFMKDSRYLYRYVPLFGISELIQPSVRSTNETYLKDLELLQESTHKELQNKALKLLIRVKKLYERLDIKLKEEKFVKLLNLANEVGIVKDDIEIYAGDTMDTLKTTDVYSLKEEELQEGNCTYLEGILFLIYTKFIKIIETLSDDVTENIQLRALYTLKVIHDFMEKLKKELSQRWVLDSLKSVSAEESDKIDKEIDEEIETRISDILEVKLDTEWATEDIKSEEDIELPHRGSDVEETKENTESPTENLNGDLSLRKSNVEQIDEQIENNATTATDSNASATESNVKPVGTSNEKHSNATTEDDNQKEGGTSDNKEDIIIKNGVSTIK